MSEAEALLALYGAIDRAVVADEAEAADLAPLLGPYRRREAVGWYDEQYLPWLEEAKERAVLREREAVKERPETEPEASMAFAADPQYAGEAAPEEPPASSVPLTERAQEIADALAAFEPRTLEGRDGARRLLAVTAAALAMPQHFGPDGSHADVARAPLVFQHPDLADEPAVRAAELHRRFATDFTGMEVWPELVESSVRGGHLPDSFEEQAAAPPCAGRLVMRPDPGSKDADPCTVLEAGFVTDKLTFEQARNYLEPSNWVFPGSLWCRMEQDGSYPDNSFLYHETVSTSGCPPSPGGWSVSTDLRFWFSHPTPFEARVEYDFPPGPLPPHSDVEIDEGSLRVIQLANGHVEVKTTKRVRFAGSFDGAGLAMLMCATGYSTILEDMVFAVTEPKSVKPFPIAAPQAAPQGVTMSPPPDPKDAAKNAETQPDGNEETLDDIAADAAELFESYLKDYTATFTSSMKKIQEGTYKVENAWADGINAWTSYMSGLGKALDLGTRTAKAAAKNPPQAEGAPTPKPDAGEDET